MIDREKVIKGLEICTTRPCYCTDCSYKANCVLDSQELMEDALAILKEQEAVAPVPLSQRRYACGNCGNSLWVSGQRFCASCGKQVKWDVRS